MLIAGVVIAVLVFLWAWWCDRNVPKCLKCGKPADAAMSGSLLCWGCLEILAKRCAEDPDEDAPEMDLVREYERSFGDREPN